jgi:hypothetical protein
MVFSSAVAVVARFRVPRERFLTGETFAGSGAAEGALSLSRGAGFDALSDFVPRLIARS